MISKNSFWVSLKENNKRRIWLWILSAFTYLVVLPTVTAMFISSYKTNNSYLIEQYGESAGNEEKPGIFLPVPVFFTQTKRKQQRKDQVHAFPQAYRVGSVCPRVIVGVASRRSYDAAPQAAPAGIRSKLACRHRYRR